AYRSTIETHLNWGTSYLVLDFYRRFAAPGRSERHYLWISRGVTVGLMAACGAFTLLLSTASEAFQLLLSVGAGTGLIYLLRWFWWRINAWSEISAMSVAAVVTLILHHKLPGDNPVTFAKSALITAFCTTVAWVVITFLTPAEPEQKLVQFYRRVHPTVYGWRRIAALVPEMSQVRDVGSNAFDWLMGCLLIYGSLFGIGKLIFGEWVFGSALLAIAAVAGYLIFWDLTRRGWQSFSGVEPSQAPLQAVAEKQR
ncbi:MAG TPA: sodium:proline symporter, partial [Candidatus Angelobacter sp.]|nr:sodium:proline symporter [Candidatus Angelobacter sp.]